MPSDGGMTIATDPETEDERVPGLSVLTLALASILIVRILGLVFASTDLHSDEAEYWCLSEELGGAYQSQPPIVIWLIGLARAICGDAEGCIRLSSPILFTVGAFLIYPLARRLYDDRVAFWSALAYATLPAVSAFAMVITPESPLSVLWIAGLLAVWIHLDRPTVATGLALGVIVGLGLMADVSMIYLPVCTTLYVILTPHLRSALRAPGTWLAIAAAILVLSPQLSTPEGFLSASFSNVLSDWTFRHLNPDATLVFIALQFVLFGPILFFVFLRTVLLGLVTPSTGSDRFLLFHSVPIIFVLLIQVLFFSARAHWTMPAFPAATIFVTALLFRYGFRHVFLVSTGIHVAMLVGIIGLSLFARHLDEVPYFDRMIGWRQFAEELSRAAALSEVNTIVIRRDSTVAEAKYYLRDTDIEILAFGRPGPDAEEGRATHWLYGDPETVLLATDRDPSAFNIPLGNADKIGEFPTQTWLSDEGTFTLYRVNPPAETEPLPTR